MKRRGRNLFFFWASLLIVSLVLMQFIFAADTPAATTSTKTFTQNIVSLITSMVDIATQAGKPLFSALLGSVNSGGDLFAKVLIFLLVLLIVVAVLDTVELFSNNIWLQYGIGVIISILGVRFLPNDMIQAIAFPSSVFVATIAIGLPFVLFGVALYKIIDNTYIRRAGWTLFIVVLIVLWVYNSDKEFFFIYPLFLIGCIIAFWFDGTLKRWFSVAKTTRTLEGVSSVSRNRIIAEIRDLEGALSSATSAKQRKDIQEQIKDKREALKSI